jgi:hypothetical protein
MVEDEWCFNLIVMCFCLHAKCLALCLASDYGSIFCFYLNYIVGVKMENAEGLLF